MNLFFFLFKIFSRYNVCVTDFQEVKLFYILDGESSVNDWNSQLTYETRGKMFTDSGQYRVWRNRLWCVCVCVRVQIQLDS